MAVSPRVEGNSTAYNAYRVYDIHFEESVLPGEMSFLTFNKRNTGLRDKFSIR